MRRIGFEATARIDRHLDDLERQGRSSTTGRTRRRAERGGCFKVAGMKRHLLFALLALSLTSLLALPGFGTASVPRKKSVYKGHTKADGAVTLKTFRKGTRLGYRVHNKSTCHGGELDGTVQETNSQDGGRSARRAKVNRRTGKFKLHYTLYPSFQDTVDIYIRGRLTRRGARGTFRRHLRRVPYAGADSICDTGVLSWKAKRTR
jgi:hypothetical protein